MKIKELREEFNYTQEEVAKKLSLELSSYIELEEGKTPTLKELLVLSNLYNVSVDYIVSLTNDRKIIYPHKLWNSKTISSKIKEAREEANLSQNDLRDALHLAVSTISEYESPNNQATIDTKSLITLSKLTNKPLDYFLI